MDTEYGALRLLLRAYRNLRYRGLLSDDFFVFCQKSENRRKINERFQKPEYREKND